MRRTPSRRRVLGTFGGLGAATAAGCLGSGGEGDDSTLRAGLGWRVLDSLGPIHSGLVSRVQLYESLIGLDHDAEFVLRLATEWDVENDDRTWWFDLRDGAVFHDGSAIDADTVSHSPERSGIEASAFDPVSAESVATDGDRVTITTEEPVVPYLAI